MSKSLLEHILQDSLDKKQFQTGNVPMIAIVGAGGKTTAALRLVKEFKEKGMTPILTTTTHMMYPDTADFVAEEDLDQVKNALHSFGSAWVGIPGERNRIGAVSDTFFEALCGLSVPVIVEADGARGKPFKMPAEWEPVIPRQTNIVVGVMGLDALRCSIKDVCYRPEAVARLLEKTTEQSLEPEDYVTIGLSEQGLKKDVSAEMNYHIILSKAEDEIRRNDGESIRKLFEQKGMRNVYLIRRVQ